MQQQQTIHIPGSVWCHPQPAYPLKNQLIVNQDELQEGYKCKAWYKILTVAQSISKVKLEVRPNSSVEKYVQRLLSEKEELKELIAQKLSSEKSSLQEKIEQIQNQDCSQFFKDTNMSGPRFELESLNRCLGILDSI